MDDSEVPSMKYVIDGAIAEDLRDVLLELEGFVVNAGELQYCYQLNSQQHRGYGV